MILQQGYSGPETTWANAITFDINHAPGAGLIDRPAVQHDTTVL